MTQASRQYLTVQAVTEEYGIAEYRIKRAIKANRLHADFIGRTQLIKRTDIEEWIRKEIESGATKDEPQYAPSMA